MPLLHRALAALAWLAILLVASCGEADLAYAQNYGQNQMPNSLTYRGALSGTDVVPCQPTVPTVLNVEGCLASDIANFVQTNPVFTGTLTVPVTGTPQCLQANAVGVVSGSGSPCPANPLLGNAGDIVGSPIQFAQIFGPDNVADEAQMRRTGVGLMWSSDAHYPVGIYNVSYEPAYRLDHPPTPNYTGSLTAWLYANHPDWIVYGPDEVTIAYEFGDTAAPPFDITNPAAQAFVMANWLGVAAGAQAIGEDNWEPGNLYQEYGHYVGTTAPCLTAQQPACGGTFHPDYMCSAAYLAANGNCYGDTLWTAANLAWLIYTHAAAAAAGFAILPNMGSDVYPGWEANLVAASRYAGGIAMEGVPQDCGASGCSGTAIAGKLDPQGFVIDQLFQVEEWAASQFTVGQGVLINDQTNEHSASLSQREEESAVAWDLLTANSPGTTYLTATLDGSFAVEIYPHSMGGYTDVVTTANMSSSNAYLTAIPSTVGMGPGDQVTGPGIPSHDYIIAVQSSTAVLLKVAPTATGTGVAIEVSGLGQLPIGYPLGPPPSVNPSLPVPTTPYYRQYSNGGVFVNAYCQIVSNACSAAPVVVTLPPLPGVGNWWDMFGNELGATYSLQPGYSLVFGYGTSTLSPWPH